MRFANVEGRATIAVGEGVGVDVFDASNGRFGPSAQAVYNSWTEFTSWANSTEGETAITETSPRQFDRADLGPPVPEPRQILAIGLNYHAHAAESGFESPEHLPPVFTKFLSSLSGPDTEVDLPEGGNTDWEVELVAVIGQKARNVAAEEGWDYIAGLTVGQDLSERRVQLRPPAAQFSLGKSFPGFAPLGPWLVTTDDVENRDDLEVGCSIDGETVQLGRTSELIFPVPALVAELSKIITLYPGDLIFTGTPAGVGVGREPQRFLQSGEHLCSWIEGIGELHQTFVNSGPR